MGGGPGWSQFSSGSSVRHGCRRLICFEHTPSPRLEDGWASRRAELGSEPRPLCPGLLVGGDNPMLRDRHASAALWLNQPSWARGQQAAWEWLGSKSRLWAHLPQGQDVAWDPGGWRFPPLSSCPHSQMLQAQAVSQQERVGETPAAQGKAPYESRAALQAATFDICPPLDSCQGPATQPGLAWGTRARD